MVEDKLFYTVPSTLKEASNSRREEEEQEEEGGTNRKREEQEMRTNSHRERQKQRAEIQVIDNKDKTAGGGAEFKHKPSATGNKHAIHLSSSGHKDV